MKKILLLITASCFFLPSWGQDRDVSGTIVSETGFPIKNIRLTVVDLPISAKTNKNGNFVLKKIRSEDTIVVHISKLNYIKFPLGENDSLKLVLTDKMIAIHNEGLSPIIAPIQTGTLYNNKVTSSSVITSKMLERRNAQTIADALKGMVPGVTVTEGAVFMRGNKSLNLSQNSLIIVDGIETSFSFANDMSVHDVDYIEINKDGFGYGVKGANGVLIIKTKRN